MIRKNLVSLAAALLVAVGMTGQEPATLLSRDTILIGDQTEWIIPLQLEKGEKFFIEDIPNPPAQNVEIIKGLEIDTLSCKRGLLDLQGKVILTSFDSGSWFLPPLIAMIERKSGKVDTLYMEGPTLEVTTVPVDTATYVIKDIKGQIRYPLTFKEVLPWGGMIVLLAAVIYVLVRYIRQRRANRTFFGKPIVKDPPHIVALRSLDRIRRQKLWQSDRQKQFYTEVTDTLRQYIADRYDIVALERPSAEMLADLKKKDVEARMYEEIENMFNTADLVKFAKFQASAEENEEVIPTAVKFVNTTYLSELDNEAEKEE